MNGVVQVVVETSNSRTPMGKIFDSNEVQRGNDKGMYKYKSSVWRVIMYMIIDRG